MSVKNWVLIADDNLPFCSLCASLLESYGYEAITMSPDRALASVIAHLAPRVVVLNMVLQPGGAVMLLDSLRDATGRLPCHFIMLSPIDCAAIERKVLAAGADCCLLQPCDLDKLIARIISLAGPPSTGHSLPLFMKPEKLSLEQRAADLLNQLGIPAHVKGRLYLHTAIVQSLENPELLRSVTKQLYPAVARSHDASSAQVERSIRRAIAQAYSWGDPAAFAECFGSSLRLTNLAFIAGAVEFLCRQQGLSGQDVGWVAWHR